MRRRLVITDVTRMQGDHVCVAGYVRDGADAGRCVRPKLRFRSLVEGWLRVRDRVVVRPFAVVEFDFLEHRPHPPHTEDWIVEERCRVPVGRVDGAERRAFLASIDDGGVGRIFGARIHEDRGWFVRAGEGTRSLGTVRPRAILAVTHAPRPRWGKWEYRLTFEDDDGRRFNLSVTDLAFRYYLDHRRDEEGVAPVLAARQLLDALRQAERVYLRIGLGRAWGEQNDRCYLQINGVYTFPDYLGGRCFTDLAPRSVTEIDLSDVPF